MAAYEKLHRRLLPELHNTMVALHLLHHRALHLSDAIQSSRAHYGTWGPSLNGVLVSLSCLDCCLKLAVPAISRWTSYTSILQVGGTYRMPFLFLCAGVGPLSNDGELGS